MGGRIPGAACQVDRPQSIDAGTSCRARSPAPGVTGDSRAVSTRELDDALAGLQAQAENFAWRYLQDAGARKAYVARIAAAARQLLQEVRSGQLSAEEAARIANAGRNTIMEEVRAITSAIGRAGAEAAKVTGLTLDMALEKAVGKLFPGKAFGALTAAEKQAVFLEVVEASGRSSPKFTSLIPRWTRFGRGLAVVTVAISVYNIWEAKNKLRQGVKEGATLAGGVLGGAAATASAGFLCGPGAPACVTVLFVVGGIVGAIAASEGADYVLDQKEVVSWLGE